MLICLCACVCMLCVFVSLCMYICCGYLSECERERETNLDKTKEDRGTLQIKKLKRESEILGERD